MSKKTVLEQNDNPIRKGVERRLEFIEYRLYWEGGLNRSDIIEEFGVSIPQASNDLSQYKELAPDNIEYDSSEKLYLPTAKFKPIFFKPNAGRYLVELKAYADQVLTSADSWIGSAPTLGVMPIPGRHADPNVLRSLLLAVRSKCAVHAHYHSMSDERPDPIWRWITPHAFGFDGLRWHVRGYCHIKSRFQDFVLSRFIDAGQLGPAGVPGTMDKDWLTMFDVVLIPNPALVESKQRTVARDYEMVDNRLVLTMRHALLYYLDKRLRLDVYKHLDKPHETPIVVSNREAFEAAIKNAKGSAT